MEDLNEINSLIANIYNRQLYTKLQDRQKPLFRVKTSRFLTPQETKRAEDFLRSKNIEK